MNNDNDQFYNDIEDFVIAMKYNWKVAEYISRYLYLIGEECMVVKFNTNIYIWFNKGIKNEKLHKDLKLYLNENDCLIIFPAHTKIVNRVMDIITSY